MLTRIRKWGNSLGVRIPKSTAGEARMEEGSVVEMALRNGCLTIRVMKSPSCRLGDLLREVQKENLHGEVGTGRRKGREIW
ncbi:MAG: multidrug transporter MatE [Planctomycetes bacterium RBG_16_59_8]|nr:MAG: multidrug transporter MatE [Planctomycetes bacterium RBG_16_59_8]